MPIGAPCPRPEPKSACSPMPATMLAINASEFGSTGRPEISRFHGLSAGNGSAPFSGAFAPSDAAERLPYVAPLAAPPCDGDADDVAAPSLPPPPPQPASQTEARVVMKILRSGWCMGVSGRLGRSAVSISRVDQWGRPF